ncbi:MAG: hypothetical protein QNJ72_24055 [Pleurocapsa sp. MO_226.B13]|nr:hypothetical protein [Pleurocapsa sp. MO_226.B13]
MKLLIKSPEIDRLIKSISESTISQAKTSQTVTQVMMLNNKASQECFQSSGRLAQFKVSQVENIDNTEQIVQVLKNNLANEAISS